MRNQSHNEIDRLAIKLKAERDRRESQRETLQIKARAIESPVYDNSDLSSLDRWLVTGRNLDVLATYFHSLAEATGEPLLDPEELRVMTVIQYERQLALRDLQPRNPEWDERCQRDRRTWQALMADEVCQPEFGEIAR